MINEQILSALAPLNVPIYFMEAEENNDSIYLSLFLVLLV